MTRASKARHKAHKIHQKAFKKTVKTTHKTLQLKKSALRQRQKRALKYDRPLSLRKGPHLIDPGKPFMHERKEGDYESQAIYYFDLFNDNIEIYPTPVNSPPTSKFEIGYVPLDLISALNQPIPSSWPLFAQKFFRYQLAKDICHVYKLNWLYEQALMEARQIMIDNSDNELAIAKTPQWKEDSGIPPISLLYFQSGGPFG